MHICKGIDDEIGVVSLYKLVEKYKYESVHELKFELVS